MRNREEKVSIIMNCFNGGKYLREALDSVLSQTYKNWELIFWDNQSTDDSADIFQEYDDIRLKYYYASNHTLLYEARILALEKAKSEYIAFLDVDDWWSNEKLSEQMPLFQDNTVGLVYSNYWLVNERKGIGQVIACKQKLPQGDVLGDLLREYVVGILTIIVRRSVIQTLDKVFDSRYQIIGDYDLVIRMAARAKFACVQKPLAYYRWHGENVSVKDAERGVAEMEYWLTDIVQYKNISQHASFRIARNNSLYLKIVYEISAGRRYEALILLLSYPWCFNKLKLTIALLMPTSLVMRLRA